MSWFVFAIVLFVGLILRRQCEDGFLAGTGFNVFGALGVGLGAVIVLETLFGDSRWALLGGIIGLAAGGFLLGMIFDSAGGGENG